MRLHTANRRRKRDRRAGFKRGEIPLTLQRGITRQANLNHFFASLDAFGRAFTKAAKPIMDAVYKLGKTLYDSAWEGYRKAGMPYGETDDGMMLWFKQECQHRREIQRVHSDYSWRLGLERLRPGYYDRQDTFMVRIIEEYKCFKVGESYAVFLSQYMMTKGGTLNHCQCDTCVKAREGQELFGMYEVSEGPRRGWLIPVEVTEFA